MTLQGRLNNVLSRYADRPSRAFGRLHARLFRRFRGTRLNKMFGAPVFMLTVRGRKTGEPRSVMLILVRRGDDVIVCGSNGGNPSLPSWYANLRAAGEGDVDLGGGEAWHVTAREVVGAEREECWRLLTEVYPDFATYQSRTDRVLPVSVLERAG